MPTPYATLPTPQQVTPHTQSAYPMAEKEINIFDLWSILVKEKRIFFFLVILCTAGAVGIAWSMTPIYEASVLLEPTSENNKDNEVAGGLGSTGSGSGSVDSNLAILQSRVFTEKFLQEEKLLPILFSSKWDPQKKRWHTTNHKKVPNTRDGVKRFREILSISESAGPITLTIEHHDRKQASRIANLLVKKINQHLRRLAIQDAKQSIKYLNAELSKTSVLELRQAIVNILEGQVKKIMMANIQTEFAFKVIDPAVTPSKNDFIKPKRTKIIILGPIAGMFLSIIIIFLRNIRQR